VTTFLELTMKEGVDLSMEETRVGATSDLIGLPLKETGLRRDLDLIVVAIKRASGEMLYNPAPDTQIQGEDTLVVLGMRQNLEALEKLVQ